MKRFALFLLIIGCTAPGFSQTDVTVNPFGLLFRKISVSVERSLSESLGLEGTAIFDFSKYSVLGDEYNSKGFGLRALGKYYFKPKKGNDRFHIGPYMRINSNSVPRSTVDGNVHNFRFSIGFYAGYKWISKDNIIIDIGAGFGRTFVNNYKSKGSSIDRNDWPGFIFDAKGKSAVDCRS